MMRGLGAIAVALPGGQAYKAPVADWRAVNPLDFANLQPDYSALVRINPDGSFDYRVTSTTGSLVAVGGGDGSLTLPSSAQVGFFWPGTGLSVELESQWPRVLLWGSVIAGVGLAVYLAWGRK